MATVAINHAEKPLLGRTTVPTGTAKLLSWDHLESALYQAGEVKLGESVACFIVADDGVWLVLERAR